MRIQIYLKEEEIVFILTVLDHVRSTVPSEAKAVEKLFMKITSQLGLTEVVVNELMTKLRAVDGLFLK